MNPIIGLIRTAQLRANAPLINAPEPPDLAVHRNIPYRDDDSAWHRLDVYSPRGFRGPLPVIVEIHGGSYLSCCKEINAPHGFYLASRGFHVVNMNYTLCPEGSCATVLNEVVDVLRWVDANAALRGFDRRRVFLTGDSAGGHFVLLSAAACSNPETAAFFAVKKPPFLPAGYSASCPGGSFAWRLVPKSPPALLVFLLLGRVTFDRACAENASYDRFMDDRFPRVWFCTTPSDGLMYRHTRQMHTFMAAREIDHVYREYAGAGAPLPHAFNILQPDRPESRAANDDMIGFFRASCLTAPPCPYG